MELRNFSWSVFCCIFMTLINLQGGKSSAETMEFTNKDVTSDKRYILGEEQYNLIKKESTMPRYSECWLRALDALDQGCASLTEDVQHRLALGFTNCFLIKTGRTSYPCEAEDPVEECLQDMTSEAYTTYANFFTHTQNICFFLQAQVWQDATETTIIKLSESSATVAEQMEDSSHLQQLMMQKQNDSIKNQEVLIEHGNQLKESLEQSKLDVHHMLEEFKVSTTEQKALMFEVFDRISSLQNIVMGELTGFYSLIFYALSITVSYLLTSTPRANGARFWLFVIMTLNMCMERMLVMFGASSSTDEQGAFIDENSAIYNRLWVCRKMFTALGASVWAWVAYHYKDLNKINNQLLLDIQKQNSDLKHLLQYSQAPSPVQVSRVQHVSISSPVSQPQLQQHLSRLDEPDVGISCHVEKLHHPHKGYESDSEDSCTSSESGISDHTFLPTEDNEWSDAESVESSMTSGSARWSREGTPGLREEAEDLRECTPLREVTPLREHVDKASLMAVKRAILASPSRSNRRSVGTPSKPSGVVQECQYFLRSMRGKVCHQQNPLTNSESAEDFGRKVKSLASIAIRNRRKTRATVQHKAKSGSMLFSSDEN